MAPSMCRPHLTFPPTAGSQNSSDSTHWDLMQCMMRRKTYRVPFNIEVGVVQKPPARKIKRKLKESEVKCCLFATDRCSSWLASAWLYNASSRFSGRPCTADILRASYGWSWLECLLHRGGSTTGPENRRRTTWWTTGSESLRPWIPRDGEKERDCQKRIDTLDVFL